MEELFEFVFELYLELMMFAVPEEKMASKKYRRLATLLAVAVLMGVIALFVWGGVLIFELHNGLGWIPVGIAVVISVVQIILGFVVQSRKDASPMEKIDEGIYRILVPFEDLTTTVYVYTCSEGTAIIDSATYPEDVGKYIVPTLEKNDIKDIKYLLFSHEHGDHMGGAERLREVYPDAEVGTGFDCAFLNRMELFDNKRIFGELYAIHLPGHTNHAYGFYDAATKTLMSADCLQPEGVGKYRNGIGDPQSYIASINKLKKMDIERIVAAHEYDPLGSIAEGKEKVLKYLDTCIKICERSL